MSNFLAERHPDSGYPNPVTLPGCNGFYRKRIFAGLLSTLMGCSLEPRPQAAPFTVPVIHQQGQLHSDAITLRAVKPRVHTKATPAIQFTVNFIATSVSICPWKICNLSQGEPEN